MRISVGTLEFKMRVMSEDIWKRITPALEELGYVWRDGTPLSNFYPRDVYGFHFRGDKTVVYCSSESSYYSYDCPEFDCHLILRNQHCTVNTSEFE